MSCAYIQMNMSDKSAKVGLELRNTALHLVVLPGLGDLYAKVSGMAGC